MKVLVTGATGPFGKAVCRHLLRAGHDVTAVARNPSPQLPPEVAFVPADVRDADAIATAMAGCDAVVHLAWVVAPLRSRAETSAINLGGTSNVLDAMAATGCHRLVFGSSVLAYGAVRGRFGRLSEGDDRHPDPDHAYAADKAAAEDVITSRTENAVLVRSGIICGRDVDNIVFRFLAQPLIPTPDAQLSQQYVHTDDVARFTAQAVESSRTGPVNIAGDDVVSMEEIAAILGRRLLQVSERSLKRGVEWAWRMRASEIAPSELSAQLSMPDVDTSRLRDEWGFRPAWSSRDAITDLARRVHGRTTIGKRVVITPGSLPLFDERPLSRLAGRLAIRRLPAEADWLAQELMLARALGDGGGPEQQDAAAALLKDLEAHARRLRSLAERGGSAGRQAIDVLTSASGVSSLR